MPQTATQVAYRRRARRRYAQSRSQPLSITFCAATMRVLSPGADMRRRQFIALVGGATLAWPLPVPAQQAGRMRRIGILLYSKQEQATISPMLRGLEALGYVDGKNVAIEYRDADGKFDRLSEAADELVRLKPDLIF